MDIRTVFRVSAFCAVTGLSIALAGISPPANSQGAPKPGSGPTDRKPTIPELVKGYDGWRKVNKSPVKMEPAAATQCASASVSQQPSPHLSKFIYVFVNKVGEDAMMRRKSPTYPVGSIIVKQKLATAGSKSPELLTVMVKRDRGYDPSAGDWEYAVLDGAGSAVKEHGTLAKCRSCHTDHETLATDHVFRSRYMSARNTARLR